MSDASPVSVGFVGLGHMGLPMARLLGRAGHDVRGYDASAEARAQAADAGVPVVESLAEAAAADVVVLMLPSSSVVRRVVDDPEFAGAVRAGALLIDMGSSEPMATRELATALAERGVRMVDAPVSGGVRGAEEGRLTIMAGGSVTDVEAARPLLSLLGRIVHAGPVGAGDAVKALNNLLSATHLWVTSEAMLVGQRFGIDPEVMLSVFNGSSGRSGSTDNKWPNFILPGTYDSGFGLRLMVKDMRIATDLARSCGLPSRLGEEALGLWAEAADGLDETADHTEVARYLQNTTPTQARTDED
jgi:3-hydroxyisobutyrate dehydrogenase